MFKSGEKKISSFFVLLYFGDIFIFGLCVCLFLFGHIFLFHFYDFLTTYIIKKKKERKEKKRKEERKERKKEKSYAQIIFGSQNEMRESYWKYIVFCLCFVFVCV